MPEGKHALYRFYNAGGVLLYVGITANPSRRMTEHDKSKDWFDKVTGIKIEWFPDRLAVLDAETLAIDVERPMFNIRRPSLPEAQPPLEHEQAAMYLNALRAIYYLVSDGCYEEALAWLNGMWGAEKRVGQYECSDEKAAEFARSIMTGRHTLPADVS